MREYTQTEKSNTCRIWSLFRPPRLKILEYPRRNFENISDEKDGLLINEK
jgi:hypothetical protein